MRLLDPVVSRNTLRVENVTITYHLDHLPGMYVTDLKKV